MFDFDTVVDRANTGSLKWDKYAGRDVIPLWVADMDFPSPPAVIDALHRRIDHGVFGYGQPPAGLMTAVRANLLSEYGWDVQPEWIVWLPGLVTGLNVLCRAVGRRGDDVATFTPIYPPFLSAPLLAERGLVKVPLRCHHGRWEMDLSALENALSPHTRLLLLCSPHNPVGRAWTTKELNALAALALRRGLVIGSDDIHAGLILDEQACHLPLACLSPEVAAQTITLMAPSKTFNIPGLGCSFAVISNPELRHDFRRAMTGIVPHVNALGYVAAQAAYEQGEPWRQALLTYLRSNRDLVESEVAGMAGLEIAHVEATYLAWIDTRGTGITNPVGFFEAAGVGLSDGTEFEGPGYVRLNFGCSRVLLTQALTRMRAALSSLHQRVP
ncbi:MAG: MalY/PatB family protein [Thermoleophilia bacterium]